MKIFTIYVKPNATDPIETAVFVPEGFSIMAFLFNLFWLLYHRIWLIAGSVFLIDIILSYAQQHAIISQELITVFNVTMITIIGFEASDWYQATLKRRGYILLDLVSGKNLEQAQQRFLDYYMAQNEPLGMK